MNVHEFHSLATPITRSHQCSEPVSISDKQIREVRWLHFAHSLTILGSLNAPLAESVLNKRFFELVLNAHKKEDSTEHLVQWDLICFRNIASAARLELPKDKVPPIDDALLDSGDPRSFSLVRDIKRGAFVEQKQSSLMERFELMFRLVAPLNSHSTSQEWHKTGAFLEGRCFVDTAEHQLVPLREANDANSNVREVAVLLLMDRHFTQSIGPSAAEEEGPDRPTGINQMNIRHLKMVGIHPIVFTERHFRELGDDERSQIKFIRERILSLSEEFHYHSKWTKEQNIGAGQSLFPSICLATLVRI
uniref:ELMO domain-containing protein n=1 Tax=Globodera pallida TaxID=36090 RepID=A0A183C3V3_GLOPA